MSEHLIVFDEPSLEFRYGQATFDPRDGLGLFGPYDGDFSSQPQSVKQAVIGTTGSVSKWVQWSASMNLPATESADFSPKLWVPFPGFEAAFSSKWQREPLWSYTLNETRLQKSSRRRDPQERAFEVVDLYLNDIKKGSKLDERADVIVCVVPDEIWLNCRPESRVLNPSDLPVSRSQRQARRRGQFGLLDQEQFDPEVYQLSPDFRRQLKARAMEFDTPIQIVRESTLRLSSENKYGERGLTPLSDRMWNLSTTMYYKAGGKPWRLMTARDGVCYIGIAFRKTENSRYGRTACCAAQMFLNDGDGLVFLGEYGPWFSLDDYQFHLTKAAAKSLLEGVLKTYSELGGKQLREVFLHSRSLMNDEEIEGYREAVPSGVELACVRVRMDLAAPRLYRVGTMPILRGSFWRLSEQSGLLWGTGFKPRLATYDGWEVPVPLRIDVQVGRSPVERVAQDIFGLTKLNYNACKLGDSQPVTIGFSSAVGEILVSNPTVAHRRPNFKYYI